MRDISALGAQFDRHGLGPRGGLVVRIVEQLDMQFVLGPIELRDASQRLLRHQGFVIDGDLQQHMGQFAVGKLHGLGVAHAANFVPQEARDDRDIAKPNDDER